MAKTRVLFLCIGNACRSPMAEGFARTYGSDVLHAQSAGLAPALAVAPLTHHVMLEKNIDLGDCYPKELEHVDGAIDLIINMSGHDVPARQTGRKWKCGTCAIPSANPKKCSARCATRSSSACCN